MHHVLADFAAIFLAVLLAGCSAQSTITPTIAPTASATAAVLASSTPTPTATLAPTLQPSPTTASVELPAFEYKKQCITIEDELPEDLKLEGALLVYGGSYWYRWPYSLYHLDFRSKRRAPVPDSAWNFSLSPDGKWLAYLVPGWDEREHLKDKFLYITNAEGRHLDLSDWPLNWQSIAGWQDDKHLLLHYPDYPDWDYIRLNPFTFKKELISILDFPQTNGAAKNYWYSGNANVQLTHWVSFFENNISVLERSDNSQWLELWKKQLEGRAYGLAYWSPDGKQFHTSINTGEKWLWMLGGQDEKLTLLSNVYHYQIIHSWSPDSRYLAGWVQLDPMDTYHYNLQLVLIDVKKQTLTDLCIDGPEYFSEAMEPVWSPDGRFLAIDVLQKEETESSSYSYHRPVWDTVIIDLQTGRGYKLEEGIRPLAWMRKP